MTRRPPRRSGAGDRGSVAVEVAVVAPILLVFLLLVVYAGHTAEATGDLQRAAASAARAASLRHHPDTATQAAVDSATANLASVAIACDPLTVDVDTDHLVPGGFVIVDLTCVATLDAVSLLGVGRQRHYHARSVEVIDTYRAQAPVPVGQRPP